MRCDSAISNGGETVLDGTAQVGKATTGAHSPYLGCGIGYVRFKQSGDWTGITLTLSSFRYGEVSCDIYHAPTGRLEIYCSSICLQQVERCPLRSWGYLVPAQNPLGSNEEGEIF